MKFVCFQSRQLALCLTALLAAARLTVPFGYSIAESKEISFGRRAKKVG